MKSNDHERAVIFSEQKRFLQLPVRDGLSVGSDSLLLFGVIVLILVKEQSAATLAWAAGGTKRRRLWCCIRCVRRFVGDNA